MLKPAPQNDDKTSITIPCHVKNLTVPKYYDSIAHIISSIYINCYEKISENSNPYLDMLLPSFKI